MGIVVFLIFAFFIAMTAYAVSNRKRPVVQDRLQQLDMEARPVAQHVGPGGSAAAGNDCLRCHGELVSLGVEPFRVGGTTGGWKLLAGEWAELGEKMLELECLVCRNCRRVEFRVPQQS